MALSHPCTLGLNRNVLKSFLGREEKREGEREREREREREKKGVEPALARSVLVKKCSRACRIKIYVGANPVAVSHCLRDSQQP